MYDLLYPVRNKRHLSFFTSGFSFKFAWQSEVLYMYWNTMFITVKNVHFSTLPAYTVRPIMINLYIISNAKTASMKIGNLIHYMKFLSPEIALYLYKSPIRPCTQYCCHVWAGAPSCYLEFLDKLQQRIYRTVGPSLAASLEPFLGSLLKCSQLRSFLITLVDVHLD